MNIKHKSNPEEEIIKREKKHGDLKSIIKTNQRITCVNCEKHFIATSKTNRHTCPHCGALNFM